MPRYGFSCQSQHVCSSIPVLNHPLAQYVSSSTEVPLANGAEFSDPLGVHFNFDKNVSIKAADDTKSPVDINGGPLENTLVEEKIDHEKDFDLDINGFRPWREYRRLIEESFHSTESLKLESSFLTSKPSEKNRKRNQSNDTPVKVHELTEDEYCRRFRDLTKTLERLWDEEKRIECIKLCTEVASFLSQPHASRFYPRKFVLVTDLLVYDRLHKKANEERAAVNLPALAPKFETADVLEKTRMRARNWFGKISEIRQVIPRIYVEMAIMSSMKFVDETSISENITRLCSLCCAVHHPLTSTYARLYLCRVTMRLLKADGAAHYWKSLNDYQQTHKQQPAALLWPALEFMIQCVAFRAVTYDDLLPLWEYCRLSDKRPFMLQSMLRALPPLYLSEQSLHACKLIAGSENFTADEVYEFGRSLLKTNVSEQNRRPILRSMWKCTMSIQNLDSFATCASVWSEFAARYFTMNEVEIIFESIIKRMSKDRKFEEHSTVLASIVVNVAKAVRDVSELLSLDVYSQFVQMISDKTQTKNVGIVILEMLVSTRSVSSIKDVKLAYQIIDQCKFLHDSVDIFTAEKELAQMAKLICSALDRVQLHSVPEQDLSFLVAARAALLDIDVCQKYVIERILELALFVAKSARYSSTRAAFNQACIANAYISVPSLNDPVIRTQLYLRGAEIAMASMTFLQSFLNSIEQYSWPNLACPSHCSLLLASIRFLYALQQPTFDFYNFNQFRLSLNSDDMNESIEELFSIVFQRVSTLIAEESELRPLVSVQFLETLAASAGRVDQIARSTAKIAYKKCKHADQLIVDRMSTINFETE
ncbi:hypothetical protein M3Y98_00923500 [Aphelenchoides besseyi]|nr:hypothetical protein M3Y98_00923500 [Aphelenchoides besseyi]